MYMCNRYGYICMIHPIESLIGPRTFFFSESVCLDGLFMYNNLKRIGFVGFKCIYLFNAYAKIHEMVKIYL